MPIPTALWNKLNRNNTTGLAASFFTACNNVDDKKQAASVANAVAAPARDKLLKLCSHFLQVVNLAIDRGFWQPSMREYYGLDKNQTTLPPLTSYSDAVTIANRIITGEANRANDEGSSFIAMALPSESEIVAALAALNTAMIAQTNAKDALIDAQQVVANFLPGPGGIDKLILDLYNDLENTYRDLPDGAKRDKCREWGVIYEGDAPSAPDEQTIAALAPAGPASVKITYGPQATDPVESQVVQYKLPGDPDYGHDATLVFPEQTLTDPAFTGAVTTFRTRRATSTGTTVSDPVSIAL
jgi:hypothetical protein